MRISLLAAAAALFAAPSVAQPQAPPKLLVVISVDQFSANLWDEYRTHFTGGFAKLAQGAVFHNGYQSHAATETCPGHSTILTGAHPARSGIVSNTWIDQSVQRSDKDVYCAEDERAPGSSSSSYTVSPIHLMVPTLGELMKQARPGTRSVAVSGKDRAAVMMSGHVVDQRWYWTGQKFATDNKSAAVPLVAGKVNALAAAGLAMDRPPLEPTSFCQAKARELPIQGGGKPVGAGRLARKAGDQAAFRASPEMDGDTLALAAGLVDEMQLGRGADPDILAVSLSATDYVGHTYGTEGEEMCLQLTELDRELGDFFAMLESRGIDYAVALTADHGGLDVPERLQTVGVKDAGRVDPALSPATMGATLVKQLGLSGPGLFGTGSFGDFWVDKSLTLGQQTRLLGAAVAAYRKHPQVEAVYTAKQIAATPMPRGSPVNWTILQKLRASYYPGRSGDFLVVLKRDITPIADTSRYVATHGSVWDYDRRVPVIFWRKGLTGGGEAPVDTVDIMPTLAAWMGVPIAPGSVDGVCVASVASCPAASASRAERGSR